MEEILLLTNITTIYVYGVITALLFVVLFIERALCIYSTAFDLGKDAPLAWFPFINSFAMASLGDHKLSGLPSAISSAALFGSIIYTLCMAVFKQSLDPFNFRFCLILYIVYSISHAFVLNVYMKKCHPEVTTGMIIISSFVPFLKYMIHINLKFKK